MPFCHSTFEISLIHAYQLAAVSHSLSRFHKFYDSDNPIAMITDITPES